MRKEKQIKYVAVRPNGFICGPVGDTEEFVKNALLIGYKRATKQPGRWDDIERLGYSVRKCEIVLIS